MTTDPFTEAANAAAREYAQTPRMNVGTVRDRIAEAYLAGSAWGREQALAQEPDDAERAVRELHRQFIIYGHEDDCPDTSDEHRGAHHHEDSYGYGENYCDQLPLYRLCDHCRDEDGERLDWPCPTVQALDSARAARRDEEDR